jgi:phosphoesterase RecJ-like protein
MPKEQNKKFLEQINNIILDDTNKTFLIFAHQNPDGDALGSALACKLLLENFNKKVQVISIDKTPSKYKFLQNSKTIENLSKDNKISADIAMFMECSNISRSGFDEANIDVKTIINIDHHKVNDYYGYINWVDATYAAVSIMIYKIFKYMNVKISKAAAECMYTGILTDTGRFQYSNTTLDVYDIVKELVKTGVDVNAIYREIYGSRAKSYISFMRIFFNHLEFLKDDLIAISYIEQDEIDLYGISNEDSDGAVDFLRDIEGVELACFIKPKSNGNYKLSLRSKKCVSVYEAAKEFGGGGHKYAAGFEMQADSAKEVKQKILKVLLEQKLWC